MPRRTAVIKYGGHAMDRPELAKAFATDLVRLGKIELDCVLVHGGGPQISSLLKRLDIKSEFVNGLRVTDAATMEAVEMVLAGQVNKMVVSCLAEANVPAVGISGRDGGLIAAVQKDPALGLVGKVTRITPKIVTCLLKNGFVPVIAPIAQGPDSTALNINADTAAGAIAGALHADYFVLISDVPGVLDARGELLTSLSRKEIARLTDMGVIHGGMLPKVEACLNALSEGAGQALILDGRAPSSLYRFLTENEPLGTMIRP